MIRWKLNLVYNSLACRLMAKPKADNFLTQIRFLPGQPWIIRAIKRMAEKDKEPSKMKAAGENPAMILCDSLITAIISSFQVEDEVSITSYRSINAPPGK